MAKEKDLSPKKALNNDQDPDDIVIRKNEALEDYSEDVNEVEDGEKQTQQRIRSRRPV